MGKNKGYLIIQRSLFDHWIWDEKPYSKGQAWIDLIRLANYEDKKFLAGRNVIQIKRGTFFTSIKHLADSWGWGVRKTRDFLSSLSSDSMVTTKSTTQGTMITIVNYAKHQDLGQTKGTTKGTTYSTTNVKQKANESKTESTQLNKVNKRKEREFFLTPTAKEIKKHFSQNDYRSDPEEFFDYYESKSWKGITDWEAAARRWERKFKGDSSTEPDPWENYEDPYAEFRDAIAKKHKKGHEA